LFTPSNSFSPHKMKGREKGEKKGKGEDVGNVGFCESQLVILLFTSLSKKELERGKEEGKRKKKKKSKRGKEDRTFVYPLNTTPLILLKI